MYLTKTRYCTAVQCPKMLWLTDNRPDAFDESTVSEAVLETGSAVGDLAMGLFGAYVEVPFGKPQEMAEATKALLDADTPVIAEASFWQEGLFCSVDILKNRGDGRVEVYEVKSSTAVKDIHLHDAAFQCHVLRACGYTIERVGLVHIDSRYERGGSLDIGQLFQIEDITDAVFDLQDTVGPNIRAIESYLLQANEPRGDIGKHCFSPYDCGFFAHCTRCLPRPNVFDLAGARTSTKLKCFEQGIVSFSDLLDYKKLAASQRMQVEHALFDLPMHVDREPIRDFLNTLSYPLYFLDFESVAPAVPLYAGTRPFEQIPFQYSLHFLDCEGGTLQHTAFLADPDGDPRRALAEQLCRDIPMDVCTTAYNMGFEKGIIRALAEAFPDLCAHLMNIHDNIRDLMVPFQKKHCYCSAMQGSYSIKYVLPALFPDDPALDYHNLEGVHNGAEASAAFLEMASLQKDEREKLRAQLLTYCHLDTLAMVKVFEKLKAAVG